MKNIITYLKRDGYSINRIASITGYHADVIASLNRDEIPNHITHFNGLAVPAKEILIRNIKERIKNYKKNNNSLSNQLNQALMTKH